MKTLKYALAAAAVLTSTSTLAFDDSRSGLQIGIGASYVQTVVGSTTLDNFSENSNGDFGGMLSLGIGLNRQLSLYAGAMGFRVATPTPDSYATVAGLGATFYLSSKATSLYVTGLYGLGYLGGTDEDRFTENSANAWVVGLGYEFSPHIQLEVDYAESGSAAANATTQHKFQAAFATAKYVWY